MSSNPFVSCRRTQMALELMFQNCVDVQSQNRDWFKHLSPKEFIKEICMIKLGGHRRAGHTSAILRAWEAYFDKVAIIFLNNDMKQMAQENSKEICQERTLERMHLFNVHTFELSSRGYDFDAVLVDCAWGLSTKELDSVIKACEPFAAACRGNSKPFCLALIQ